MEPIKIQVSVELNVSQDVKNFLTSLVSNVIAAPAAAAPAAAPAAAAPAAAAPAAAPAAAAPAAAAPAASISIEQVRQALAAKVNGHREEIKAKLNSLGAPSVTKLNPEYYPEMLAFLNALA